MTVKRDFKPITRQTWHKALLLPKLVNVGSRFRIKFYVLDDNLRQTENIATNYIFSREEISELFGERFEEQSHTRWRVYVDSNPNKPQFPTITNIQPYDEAEGFFYPEWLKDASEEWQGCKNGEPLSEVKRKYLEDRANTDKVFARTKKVRDIQNALLSGKGTNEHCLTIFGCSRDEVRKYIEKQFQAGMTWSNRGSVWHLDHIKPLVSFDLFDKEQLKQATHYTNYQPLLKADNINKWAN